MDRRRFLSATSAAALGLTACTSAATAADEVVASAGALPTGPALLGSPVVSGPAPESISILQPLQRHATGYLEFALDGGPFQRVDADSAGLLPFEPHVLKFRLPPLPPGKQVRYRITAWTIAWVPVREFTYGEIVAGEPEVGEERTFRTLDPAADSCKFVVWNDTHENEATLRALVDQTRSREPDFLLWNGDQTNDVHHESKMAAQFLAPAGLAIADRWPLAYVRGNHDVRGPAARSVPAFTGTPDDRFYYAFRSGPVAALVMDTGEDKPDSHEIFRGLAAFQQMQERQAQWLATTVKEPWFRDAPFKLLFCHIPLWFVRDIFPTHGRWEFHSACQAAWVPTLQEAGVQLVISGHTHDDVWMPAKEGQPLGQLIGGGPDPRYATIIHGSATRERLTLTMEKLDGTVLNTIELSA